MTEMDEVWQRLEELERRMSQMVVRGTVAQVDPAGQRVRVRYGENELTAWLPWKPLRTGKTITWWTPDVGEGVTVISDGDLENGEVLPGSYYDQFPAPSADPALHMTLYPDGTKTAYHHAQSRLTVEVNGDCAINTRGWGQVVAQGPLLVKSDTRLKLQGPSRTMVL